MRLITFDMRCSQRIAAVGRLEGGVRDHAHAIGRYCQIVSARVSRHIHSSHCGAYTEYARIVATVAWGSKGFHDL